MTMTYRLPITAPKSTREGLMNHLQMVINHLEDGDTREALLTAVDLRDRLECAPKLLGEPSASERRRAKGRRAA
jgi:hypothetical protein